MNAAAETNPVPVPAYADDQIIAKHDPSVRSRARLELQIVNKLIACAQTAGYKLEVDDGENDDRACRWWNLGPAHFKSALFNLDMVRVVVRDQEGCSKGWALLVFGNSGWDLISDYTTRLEEFLKPANDLADALSD
jgi:hypothetical protein